MYCRNCGNEVKENSVVCLGCGLSPFSETKFCQECGVETNEKQVLCIKCGCSLNKKQQGKGTNVSNSTLDGFYCSSDDKVILGLCGGLAHKFGMQTSTVRLLTFLFSGIFGWLYLAGFVLPKQPTKS